MGGWDACTSGSLAMDSRHRRLTSICAACVGVTSLASSAPAVVTLTTLKHFSGPDGKTPYARLTLDPSGNLYGNTYSGGTSVDSHGTVFKIAPNGDFATIFNFTGTADGSNPRGGLVFTGGNLFGTAVRGGTNNKGVVFRLTPTGAFNTLVTFA